MYWLYGGNEMSEKKLPLYYKDKEIGYAITDVEKNEITCYITAPIGVIQEILKSNTPDNISIGFEEECSNE